MSSKDIYEAVRCNFRAALRGCGAEKDMVRLRLSEGGEDVVPVEVGVREQGIEGRGISDALPMMGAQGEVMRRETKTAPRRRI